MSASSQQKPSPQGDAIIEETGPCDSTTRASNYRSLRKNDILPSNHHRYKVLDKLDRGTFGLVVKASKIGTDEEVAIKVLNNDSQKSMNRYLDEANALNLLKSENVDDEFNIIRTLDYFIYEKKTFFVFELLERSLYSFMAEKNFQPMSLKYVRLITQQVLTALLKLKELGLIHADLKPENIMMVDSIRQPYRIKLIDFGSSVLTSKVCLYSRLQSLYYRAPEIILDLRYNEAIDMWSLGCIMVELFLAWPLYPGENQYGQLSYICQTQGLPPNNMLDSSIMTTKYFVREPRPPFCWRLKTPDEYDATGSVKPFRETRKYVLNCLEDIGKLVLLPTLSEGGELLAEQADRSQFVDLIKRMLAMEKDGRITPAQSLDHPYLSMRHFDGLADCNYIKEGIESMLLLRR